MRLAGHALIKKMEKIEQERQRLRSIWLHPRSEYLEEANKVLGSPLVREASGEDLLRRPEMTYDILTSLTPYKPAIEDREAVEQVEIAIKYQGYIEHQQEEIEKKKRHENTAIPANFDYSKVSGLSNEVRAKLEQHRPVSIGQASRISGITPAAISIILVNLKKTRHAKTWGIKFLLKNKSAVNFNLVLSLEYIV